jgi:hypothetical protein
MTLFIDQFGKRSFHRGKSLLNEWKAKVRKHLRWINEDNWTLRRLVGTTKIRIIPIWGLCKFLTKFNLCLSIEDLQGWPNLEKPQEIFDYSDASCLVVGISSITGRASELPCLVQKSKLLFALELPHIDLIHHGSIPIRDAANKCMGWSAEYSHKYKS